MSPFSVSRIARTLRNNSSFSGRLVLDFRDPWIFDGWQPQKSHFHWIVHKYAMQQSVAASDGIIANTPEVQRLFREEFTLPADRLTTITNGYDAKDFDSPLSNRSSDGLFHLVHTGALHTSALSWDQGPMGGLKRLVKYSPEQIDHSGRTLIYLARALEELSQRSPELFRSIRVDLLGTYTEADVASVRSSSLKSTFNFQGYKSHAETVQTLRAADALFLPLHDLKQGRSLIIPGKTFEYLASGRPILGALPEGDAKDLVSECDGNYVVPPTDVKLIARAIVKLMSGKAKKRKDREWIEQFSREALTARLDKFLKKLLALPPRTHE